MSGPTVTALGASVLAGWYGKLPALGDFASRRLPPEFIGAWDGWLQGGLSASRGALGERWHASYLNSPIWRYLLLPGACGPDCWTGIMLPSVDKLGRPFPLTIAVALDAQTPSAAAVFSAHTWFDALEQIALDSLNLNTSVDALEKALATLPYGDMMLSAPVSSRWLGATRALGRWWAGSGATPILLHLDDADAVPEVIDGSAWCALADAGLGRSLWWHRDSLAGSAALLAFSGLPPSDHFAILLAGGPGPSG